MKKAASITEAAQHIYDTTSHHELSILILLEISSRFLWNIPTCKTGKPLLL